MGALDRVISRNALTAIERAKVAKETKDRNWSTRSISLQMAPFFEPTVGLKSGKAVAPPEPDSVYAKMILLLQANPKAIWDSRYLEAFCRVIAVPPERLCAADYDQAKRDPTDYAQFLARSLGRELDPPQIQGFVRIAKKIAGIPERFRLLERIADILSSAKSKGEADFEISEAVRRSRNWEQQGPESAEEIER